MDCFDFVCKVVVVPILVVFFFFFFFLINLNETKEGFFFYRGLLKNCFLIENVLN